MPTVEGFVEAKESARVSVFGRPIGLAGCGVRAPLASVFYVSWVLVPLDFAISESVGLRSQSNWFGFSRHYRGTIRRISTDVGEQEARPRHSSIQ